MAVRKALLLSTAIAVLGLGLAGCASERPNRYAGVPVLETTAEDGGPALLDDVQAIKMQAPATNAVADETRLQAMREEALRFGMQAGLARRSWEINQRLEQRADRLSAIYAFERLRIGVPDGVGVIVPPVIEEASDALKVSDDGASAAAAFKVLRIIEPARISTTMPSWRSYLMRSWETPELPGTGKLLPTTEEERALWRQWVADGWDKGRWQADTIFEQDMARLTRDFTGMTRYMDLVETGVVEDLYLAQADLGVTGGGDEMRVGDRLVRITEPVRLQGDASKWKPILINRPHP